jgi:uncharacterized phage protein (TIGR02216 family)
MSGAGRFDWAALIRAGFQRLGLTPTQFWALTPAELLMLLGQDTASAPMNRRQLQALAERFPDNAAEKADE